MPQKLSPYKVSKMMALYFDGYSQSEIANKLKIDKSTVSLQVSKFKSLADAEEYGIMDQIESLHSLASELKKEQLTVEEAKVGLKVVSLFQKLGVKAEAYQDVIQAATKLKTEGFLESAVELNKLEKSSGMSHKEVVVQATTKYESLKKSQQDLEIVTGTLNAYKEDLVAIENQKQLASQDLQAYMQQIDLDVNRLALVEELASTLKKAGISNANMKVYIQRQQLLNEAGISIDIFVSILEKADVVTSKDHGEGLFQMLAEYGSLSEVNKTLQVKAQLLEKETSNLEQRAQLKGEIEGKITELKTEKSSLEAYVSELYDQKNKLDNIKSDISSLAEKKDELKQEIAEMETCKGSLSDDIKSKEKKTGDLKDLELKHAAVLASLSETETKLDKDKRWLELFESFLGLVQSSSIPQLEKFIEELPYLLSLVKAGKYSPETLRKMVIKNLTGDALQVLKCTSCQVNFVVDKSSNLEGYYCPICGLSLFVNVDKDALAILKAALAPPKYIAAQKIVLTSIQPPLKDKGDG
ncbi:hypothetical protein ACFLWI_06010 [Chloroflexota bacterium]